MNTVPTLTGVFSAVATPIASDGNIDHATFAEHCRLLLAEGCHGLAPLGTTGEANSFGMSERIDLLERLIANGIDADRLLPGTALTSLPDTAILTRHAVEAGVRAVLLLPPFYYKDVTDEGLFRYFGGLVEAIADPRLRIVLYHIPQISGIGISHPLISRLRAAYPGVFIGIKDSAGDIDFTAATIAAFPGFSVLAGSDRHLLPVLRANGAGCITASSNLIARDLRFIFDRWTDAESAGKIDATQARIEAWRNLVIAHPQAAAIKTMLARRRNHPGWRRMRVPMVELGPELETAVLVEMMRLEALAAN